MRGSSQINLKVKSMKKLVLAFAAAASLGLAALGSSTSAEAKWGGHGGGFKGHGFHHGGGFKAHWGGHGHWKGHGHWGFKHHGHWKSYGYGWGHRWGGVRVVSYGYSSCWRYRWTPYGYRYVNICRLPIYY